MQKSSNQVVFLAGKTEASDERVCESSEGTDKRGFKRIEYRYGTEGIYEVVGLSLASASSGIRLKKSKKPSP